MRILFINPWIMDFKAYDEWMRPLPLFNLIEKYSGSHEIGLIDCLSAVAEQKKYHTADYVSAVIEKPAVFEAIPRKYKRYGMTIEDFRTRLNDFGKPDIIGITTLMTYWYPAYKLAAEEIVKVWDDVPVIMGGVYANLMPKHVSQIKGIKVYDHENFNFSSTGRKFLKAGDFRFVLPIKLQEGCPFKCEYCASSTIHGNNIIQSSLETNLLRLDSYTESGGIDVVFYDDALLYDFENMFGPFLKHIIDRRYNLRMHFPNGVHARYVNAENSNLMLKAGVKTVRLGYEKPGHAEKICDDELTQAVAHLRSAGFDARDIGAYLMAGLEPGISKVKEGIDFVHSLGIRIFLNQFSPVPGSVLFKHKANQCPELLTNPLLHNDTSYIFTHERFDWREINLLKSYVKNLNREIV